MSRSDVREWPAGTVNAFPNGTFSRCPYKPSEWGRSHFRLMSASWTSHPLGPLGPVSIQRRVDEGVKA